MSVNLITPPIAVSKHQTIQLQVAVTIIRSEGPSKDQESGPHGPDSPTPILQQDGCWDDTRSSLQTAKLGSIRGRPLAKFPNGIKYRTLPTRRPARLRLRQPYASAISSASTLPERAVKLEIAGQLHEDVAEGHHDDQTEKMVLEYVSTSLTKQTNMDVISETDATDSSSVEEPKTVHQVMFDTVRQGFRTEFKQRNEMSLRRNTLSSRSSSTQPAWSTGDSTCLGSSETTTIAADQNLA